MGFDTPGALNRFQGSVSQGRGRGGQCRRNRFFDPGPSGWLQGAWFGRRQGPRGFSAQDPGLARGAPLETLKAQAVSLEEALEGIKLRIRELEAERKQ